MTAGDARSHCEQLIILSIQIDFEKQQQIQVNDQ